MGAGDTLKDVRSIVMTPARTLWVASDKAKSAIPFAPDGKMGPGLAGEDLQTMSVAATGDLLVVASRAVRIGPKNLQTFAIPGSKPGETEPLDKLEAASITPGGAVLVSDEKKKKVFRFDGRYQYQGPFPDVKERQVSRMGQPMLRPLFFNVPGDETEELNRGNPASDEHRYRDKVRQITEMVGKLAGVADPSFCQRKRLT